MIGVFDSGFGGLTILQKLRHVLPQYDYLYLGDNARAPYGSRSFETIYRYTLQSVRELFHRGCPLVILACNTASAKALRSIQQQVLPVEFPDRRVLGIVRPTAEEIAKQQEAVARARAAMPVKDIVGEINPQVLFNNKRTGYGSYLPLEKLSFQKTSLPQFLSFLNTAVPDDIGFSECVYQAPNYYYLRGVAMKASSQHTLMDRLKAVSKQFQSPIASEAATEVAAFGQFSVPQVRLDAVRGFVPVSEIASEVKAFKSLAASNKVQLKGLEKPVVEDFGVFKRYAYNVSSTADFADLLNFMNAFAKSPIRMGVPKAELKYAKKFLISNLRVEMFVLR